MGKKEFPNEKLINKLNKKMNSDDYMINNELLMYLLADIRD